MAMINRDPVSAASGRLRPALLLSTLGLLLALAPLPLRAQDGDAGALAAQVDRLQRELSDLQRQVSGAGAAGAAAMAGGGGSIDASQEIRMQQLESELRDLTGQVEQAAYGVRQLTERLDKLAADVDFRLRAIEQGPKMAGQGAPPAKSAAAGAAPAPAGAGAPSTTPGATAPGPGAGPQTLGVLTQDQLKAFEEQEAGASERPAPPAQGETALATPAPASPGGTPEEQYDYAFGLLRQANYAEAENALKGFVERYPNHPLAGNAQYWLGETYYVRGDYTRAAVAFAEGYQKYPKGGKAPDNLLKLGMSLAEIGQKADACRSFAELSRKFPNAPENLKERASRESQRNGCS